MNNKIINNQNRRKNKGIKTAELDGAAWQQIDSVFRALNGPENAKNNQKIKYIVDFVIRNIDKLPVEVDSDQHMQDLTQLTVKPTGGHHKVALKTFDELKTLKAVRSRLEKIFAEIDLNLQERYFCSLMEALTEVYRIDPKKIDALVDGIGDGSYTEKKLNQLKKQVVDDLRVQPDRALLAKDEGLMSDSIFKSFVVDCGLAKLFPTLDVIKAQRQMWNSSVTQLMDINEVKNKNNECIGYHVSVARIIKLIIEIVQQFAPDTPLPDTLEFKVSLDGRIMHSKKEILVGLIPTNLSYVVQNEYSVFPIAIFTGDENFDFLKETLKPISEQIAHIRQNGIDCSGHSFKVATKVVADLAALWAMSEDLEYNVISLIDPEFCPYCHVRCSQRYELNHRRRAVGEFLLGGTPENFIFCALHMRIRITERLLQNIAHYSRSKNQNKEIENLNKQLKAIGVQRLQFKAKGKKTKKDSDPSCRIERQGELRGHELKLIFENIDKLSIAREEERRQKYNEVWISWKKIQYFLLQTKQSEILDRIGRLPDLLKNFFDNYVDTFGFEAVTPYIHILCAHLTQILLQHGGSVAQYSQEGFEATHKFHRRIFQRATSHNGGLTRKAASIQILQRVYRTIFLRLKLNIAPHHSATFPKLQAYSKKQLKRRKDKKTSDVPPLSEKVDDYFYNDEIILPLEDGIEPIQDVLMESTF